MVSLGSSVKPSVTIYEDRPSDEGVVYDTGCCVGKVLVSALVLGDQESLFDNKATQTVSNEHDGATGIDTLAVEVE